jgi:hypothetical protein
LRRLAQRGLNIRHVKDQRSHTKYCYLGEFRAQGHLGFLLADDDMIYGRNWYSSMIRAATENPFVPAVRYGVQLHIQEGVVVFGTGKAAKDLANQPTNPNELFHPFSGSGLFLPEAIFAKINVNPDAFLSMCPSNDDIWIHRELFRMGVPIRNLGDDSMPPSIPLMPQDGLFQINWEGGQNKNQLETAFRGLI